MVENDFIPGMDPEVLKMGQDQEKTQEKVDQESITTITDMSQFDSFCSWGLSSKLMRTRGGKKDFVQFPIKSVGVADIIDQYQENAPRAPSMIKTYRKGSDVANRLGSKFDVVVREIDESDPDYIKMKEKADTQASQMIILSGLAMDLVDPKTKAVVVKGADVSRPNEILERDGALRALRAMGMSGTHFSALVTDIRLLTQDADEAERLE